MSVLMCVYVLLNIWCSAITRISDARRMIEISAKCVWLKSGLAANFHNGINVRITRSYFCNTQTVVCNHESVTWIIPKISNTEILRKVRWVPYHILFLLYVIVSLNFWYLDNVLDLNGNQIMSFHCNSNYK